MKFLNDNNKRLEQIDPLNIKTAEAVNLRLSQRFYLSTRDAFLASFHKKFKQLVISMKMQQSSRRTWMFK